MGSLQMHSLACSAWETVGICSRHTDIGKAQVSAQRASCLEETYNYLLIDEKISWLHRKDLMVTEIKLPTSAGSWKNQESFRKTSSFVLLTKPKPLTMWITKNCGKLLNR